MNRDSLVGIMHDLRMFEGQLPDGVLAACDRVENMLARMDAVQVSVATDGVVTEPAGQLAYDNEDLNMSVQELYDLLNEYAENNRAQGEDEQLASIVNRLRGEVDTYERDFP